MKKTLLVLGLLSQCHFGHSAVSLRYNGSVIPNDSTWSLNPAPSGVNLQLLTDQGRSVLKITDVGNASNPRFLNIRSTLTVNAGNDLFSNDWEFKITMKVPGFDDASVDAWDVGQNMFTSLVRDLGSNVRHMYSLHFGRDATGMTIVKSGTSSQATTKLLSSDYHEYKVTYDRATQVSKIFIDGTYWQDLVATVTTGEGGYFTFGDNNNQSGNRPDRWHFVDDVSLMNVPEPSQGLFLWISATVSLLRRKRKR